MSSQCIRLADEVEKALKEHAVYTHPKYGPIYAFEVDGFGNHILMDDANVPSLLAMPYLGDVDVNDRFIRTPAVLCGAKIILISSAEQPEKESEDRISATIWYGR